MKRNRLGLQNGALWKDIIRTSRRALEIGALEPILTDSEFVRDDGFAFFVRIILNLARKAEDRKTRAKVGGPAKEKINPFLPYEQDMFVADISDTHVCLLNKFNVIDHHLLVVTRAFEDQEMLLTVRDFEAILACMAQFEGLAFYNGGEAAGASQQHKHLQMIPLPMAEKGPKVPIEPLFEAARFEDDLGLVPGLPFVHSFAMLDPAPGQDPSKTAYTTWRLYLRMLRAVGLNPLDLPENSRQPGPYNFLFTREWMLMAPRSREFFGPISINALAFAGALLVQNEQQMRMIKDRGAMEVLRHTGIVKQ